MKCLVTFLIIINSIFMMILDIYTDILGYLFWVLLFIAMLSPWLSMRSLQHTRLRLIALMERKYGSRVITMIHRQERIGLLGVPIYRYIDIEDSEAIIRAIRTTPPNMPIMLILHTPGGLVLAASQIAKALSHIRLRRS